jgi:pyruvate dehydrogenase E1 component
MVRCEETENNSGTGSCFWGAGWKVIKVIWGKDWDTLLEQDKDGELLKVMNDTPDGQFQKYVVSSGDYFRKDFFGKTDKLLNLVSSYSDEQLQKLRRGGHDPVKVYNAYKAAVESKGKPTVILAQTIKGYGLGEAGEGRNITHQQKKLNEEELLQFRSRFGIPLSDEEAKTTPFYKPSEDSEEIKYLKKRREELGGFLPVRIEKAEPLKALIIKYIRNCWKVPESVSMLQLWQWYSLWENCCRIKTWENISFPSFRTNQELSVWMRFSGRSEYIRI